MSEIINSSESSTPIVHLTVAQTRELIRQELSQAVTRTPQEERLLDAAEAATLMSVSPDWLYRNSKKLPFARKLGPKMLRFSYQGIMKYLASRQVSKN